MNVGRLVDRLPPQVAVQARARFGHRDPEIAHLSRFVAAGDAVMDVGAHKGAYTWHLAKLVGTEGRVHAFEPQPDLAARLRRGLPRTVTVHECALSDRDGVFSLSIPVWGDVRMQGHATLETTRPGREDEDHIQVPTRVTDHLGLSPTFIKVDIEGHELAMLRGAEQTIRSYRPVLLLEIDYRHHGEGPQRRHLIAWIDEHGYAAHYVDGEALCSAGELPLEQDPNDSLSVSRYVYNWFLLPRR